MSAEETKEIKLVQLDLEELKAHPEYVSRLNLLLAQLNPSAWVVSWLDLDKWLADPSFVLYGAVKDDCLVGMASLHIVNTLMKRIGLIENVIVSESARGQGIGEMLTRKLLGQARELKVDCLDLTSSRKAAQKLYEKLGWQERRTKPYRLKLTNRAT